MAEARQLVVMNILFLHGLLAATILAVATPVPALAYFDLGVGQYLLQIIFAFVAAFWLPIAHRLKKKQANESAVNGSDIPAGNVTESSTPANEQSPLN